MAYNGSQALKIARRYQNPGGVNVETIATNKTLTYRSGQFQLLTNTTGGALNCTLPAEADGAYFWIRNQAGSTQNISVNNPAASGVVILAPGEAALCVCDSSSWTVFFKA